MQRYQIIRIRIIQLRIIYSFLREIYQIIAIYRYRRKFRAARTKPNAFGLCRVAKNFAESKCCYTNTDCTDDTDLLN